jgi:hypothetical protein
LDEGPQPPSRARPDFLAPSPRVIIEAGGFTSLQDMAENEDEDMTDPIGDLDGSRPTRYYQSEKVLGHLYRAIDEHQFLQDMRKIHQASTEKENTVLPTLWSYIQQNTKVIQWEHHKDLARQIREG